MTLDTIIDFVNYIYHLRDGKFYVFGDYARRMLSEWVKWKGLETNRVEHCKKSQK